MLPEIVELPRLVSSTTVPHQLLIDKYFDGTKVPCEVACLKKEREIQELKKDAKKLLTTAGLVRDCPSSAQNPRKRH